MAWYNEVPNGEGDVMTCNEAETLRGEKIQVFSGKPAEDIPCLEVSDADRLCRHPVVSVHMLAYRHEPYIRQAIEGVVGQITDFEYELVIGEDASPDATREICFEYQKKYPDKIRVLWWHDNVSCGRCDAGDNNVRTTWHCRGAYISFCEGDDYWTDPYKLQKQVDVMRANPSVGLCFARASLVDQISGRQKIWDRNGHIPPGLISGGQFFKWYVFGRSVDAPGEDVEFLMTATMMIRTDLYQQQMRKHDIFSWRLCLGDSTTILSLAAVSDLYYIPEVVAHYRVNPGGVCSRHTMAVCRDAQIVRLYWVLANGVKPDYPMGFLYGRLFSNRLRSVLDENPKRRVDEAKAIMACPEFAQVSGTYRRFVVLNSKWWVPTRLMLKGVALLSLIRRRVFSDMSK